MFYQNSAKELKLTCMSTEGKTNAISRKAKSNVDIYDPIQFVRATVSSNCGNARKKKTRSLKLLCISYNITHTSWFLVKNKLGAKLKPLEKQTPRLTVTTSCKSTWDIVLLFALNGLSTLALLIPPSPLNKVASNTRPCSTLGGTTLNGREGGGQYYISQTCDQQRFEGRKIVFSSDCLNNIFATGCSSISHFFIRERHGYFASNWT